MHQYYTLWVRRPSGTYAALKRNVEFFSIWQYVISVPKDLVLALYVTPAGKTPENSPNLIKQFLSKKLTKVKANLCLTT